MVTCAAGGIVGRVEEIQALDTVLRARGRRAASAALDLTPADAPLARLQLLIPLARAVAACGRLTEAGERVQQALELVPDGEPAGRVELITLSAGTARLSGRHTEASAQLVAALDALGGQPSPARCALEIELAAEPGYTRNVSAAKAGDFRAADAIARGARARDHAGEQHAVRAGVSPR